MNPVDRSLAVVEASLVGEPSFLAAAQRLSSARYRLALVGPSAIAASEFWRAQGLAIDLVSQADFVQTVETLSPAIAIAPEGQSIPVSVPNRLLWSTAPNSRYTDGVFHVRDFSAWVSDYLAPRVPRHFSEQTSL